MQTFLFFKAIGGFYSCAIASGGGQEFISLKAEAFLAMLMMSLVYPIPVHWIRDGTGWLRQRTLPDLAGSGWIHQVCHLCTDDK